MGKVLSAAVVGVMVQRLKPRTCIELVAVLPLVVICSSFVLHEERTPLFSSVSHLVFIL
jgi:hypothetical protein